MIEVVFERVLWVVWVCGCLSLKYRMKKVPAGREEFIYPKYTSIPAL